MGLERIGEYADQVNEIAGQVDEAVEQVSEVAEQVDEAADCLSEEAAELVNETVDQAEEAVETVAEEAAGLAEETADLAEEAANLVTEELTDLTEEAAELVEETVEQAEEAADQVAEEVTGQVNEAIDEVGEAADLVTEEVADLAQDATDLVEETVEQAEEAADLVTEEVNDLAEETADLADEAAELANEAVDQAEEAAEAVAEETAELVDEAAGLAGEEVADLAEDAAEQVEDAAARADRGFEELFGQLNAASGGSAGTKPSEDSASVFAGSYAPEDISVNVNEPAGEKPAEPAGQEGTGSLEEPAPVVMDVINPAKTEEDPFANLDSEPKTEGEAGELIEEESEEEAEEEDNDHISPATGRDSRELKAEKRFDLGFGIVFWILFGLGVLALAYPFVAAKVEKIPFYPEAYSKICLFLPAVMGFVAAFTAHLGPFKGFMIFLFTGAYSLFCSAIGKENPRDIKSYLPEILTNVGRYYYITIVAILIGALLGYVVTLIFNNIKHKTMEVTKEDRKSAFCALALMLLLGFSLFYLLGGKTGWEFYAYGFAGLILLFCLAHAIRSGFSVGAMIGCDFLLAIALVAGWWFIFRQVSVIGDITQSEKFESFLFDRHGLYFFLGGALAYLFVEFIGGVIYDGAEALVGMLWLLSVTAVGLPLIWGRIPLLGQLPPLVCLIICAVILGVTLLVACLVRGFSVGKVIVGIFLAMLYLFADWLKIVLDGGRGDIYYFTDWNSIIYMIVAAGLILVACLIGGLVYRSKKKRGEEALEEDALKDAPEEAAEGAPEEADEKVPEEVL